MLLIARYAGNAVYRFEFDEPLDPVTTDEQRVREIMADYRRRDELIDIGFSVSGEILVSMIERSSGLAAEILFPIIALGFLSHTDGEEAIAKHLGHPDPAVRLAVIRSLGSIGKFVSVPRLLPFLKSPVLAERREAIIALGKFAQEELVPAINAAAGDDPALQLLAQQARIRIQATNHGIETENYQPLVDALLDTGEFEDLLPVFFFTAEPVKVVLRDRSRPALQRERALRLFIIVRSREIIPELRQLLLTPAEPLSVRLRAIYGLGRARSRGCAPLIVERLLSQEPGMAAVCVHALGQIGDPNAIDPLLSLWQTHPALREATRMALHRICSDAPAELPRIKPEFFLITAALELVRVYRRELIEPALLSPAAAARRDAYRVLAVFGESSDVSILTRAALSDPDAGNREIASLAATRLMESARIGQP